MQVVSNGIVFDGSAAAGCAIGDDGAVLMLGSWPQTFAYDTAGNLTYTEIAVPESKVRYRQTFTYANGRVVAVSQWIKQK